MSYPVFTLIPLNSFGINDVGSLASPTLVDIDSDGDLDAFVGESSGNTLFFKNTGAASNPIFAAAVTNPFGLSDVGYFASPSLVDIDGDSDLDIFVGTGDGNILFSRNTGTVNNPVFAALETNPFGLSNIGYSANPTLFDIDDDGDLDAFVGNNLGNTLFFQNTGTVSNPIFAAAVTNPFGLTDVGFAANPTLVDIDGDGDLDAFVGNSNGYALFFKNTGTASNPTFAAAVINPFGFSNVGSFASPIFVDINNDNDLDAFVGNNFGNTLFLQNKGTDSNPAFAAANTTPFGLSNVGSWANPTLVDIDNDGDLDAFVGNSAGNTMFFQNTDTASNPIFAAAVTNPFGLSNVSYNAAPTFVDIDGDGDLDAFIGESSGNTLFFRNTGTTINPVFAAAEINPFGLSNVDWSANPTFIDIDGDGDLDAFVGNYFGDTLFFRNIGTTSSPAFNAPETNPFGLGNVSYHASPTFVDIDGDGDLDAFVSSIHAGDMYSGGSGGDTMFFENTGTINNPVFVAPETNPFGFGEVGWSVSPTFVDIDDDGDMDAFVGNKYGDTLFLVNHSGLLLASTAGNDILTGSSSNNNDTVTYASATGPVTVSLNITSQQNTIGAGLDTLISIENLIGSPFNDNLTGDPANNVLRGGDGNDILRGWSGADTMIGGFGDDSYFVENVGDVIVEYRSRGTDSVYSNVTYYLSANIENLTLTGASAINGAGNSENNNIIGNAANNILSGGWGSDTLNGGAGADTLIGDFGDDSYVVDNVNDVIIENPPYLYYGMDNVSTSVSYTLPENVENLTLTGALVINGTGNGASNNITGNEAINILSGEAGNDILDGGAGADTLIGGLGSDNYIVDNTGDIITENLGEGFDNVNSSVTYTLPVNVENLILAGILAINGTGNNQANNITGNNAANQLNGGAANDTLDGSVGDDTLNGGTGTDTMIGGSGNDSYFVDNVSDVVTENLNEGTDTVNNNVTYTLPTNVENLIFTGTAAINGTGNGLNNIITGNNAANQLNGDAGNDTLNGGAGNDTLIGWSGADTMIGGSGNDSYFVENVGDVVTENLNEGTDTVNSNVAYTLPANVENLTLTGTSAVNGTGNGLANMITGNTANNQLNGGAGNDTLDGGLGANKLTGGTGNDNFKFTTKGHIDTITDYNVANDTIQLENAVFMALTATGTLAASQFRIGAKALDANDFIIYNKTAGALLYDADGNGAGAALQIAIVSIGLAMTNADIVVM